MDGPGNWEFCRWLNHLHMASVVADGFQCPATPAIAAELASAAHRIADLFGNAERKISWRLLIGAAAGGATDCDSLLTDFARSCRQFSLDPHVEDLAAPLGEILASADQYSDNAEQEVALRMRPLREQWEARGPGLLKRIQQLTGESNVEPPKILPVLPVRGGGGDVHFPFQSVHVEVVLANPIFELPEILRVGWLIATWQSYRKLSATDRNACVSPLIALASVPLVLRAAEEVELTTCDVRTVSLAVDAWIDAADRPVLSCHELCSWWQNAESSTDRWTDRLIPLIRASRETD